MKKIVSIILSALMVISLAACSSPETKPSDVTENTKSLYKAGTYTGKAQGRNDTITVDVSVSETDITSVSVKEHKETEGIVDAAIEQLPSLVLKHQSLGIDAITGATVTSDAILSAIADALSQAGADIEALKNKEIEKVTGKTIEKTADVIIVGGGGAGISAATAAVGEGKSVILVEKTASLGGNTLVSGGVWNAADEEINAKFKSEESRIDTLKSFLEYDESQFEGEFSDAYRTLKSQINDYLENGTTTLFDSEEFHLIQSYIGGHRKDLDGNTIYGDYDLLHTLTSNSNKTIKWLQETTGSEFRDDVLIEPNGALWKRAHVYKNSKAEDLFNRPKNYVMENGGEIIFECKAEELLVDGSSVVGVRGFLSDGSEVILHANKGVILATGGFGANHKMVQEYDNYWGDLLKKVAATTNISATVGEGIIMAQDAVNAAITGMEFTQLNPVGFASNGVLAQGNGGNVFYVTPEGKRFVNEYAERDVVSKAAIENGGQGGLFYEIGLKSNMAASLSLWQEADCFEANTIEELAGLIGIDPTVLVEEVDKYNGYVSTGVDPEFNKNVFTAEITTKDGDTYVARSLSPSIHHTMGGLVIDTDCHVYNESGEIIKGLYAAGEVTGGIHAGNRLGGNAIADVFTFGRIAGTNAANGK